MNHIKKSVDYKLLEISSTVFKDGEWIPSRFTCDGANINPPLDIKNIPANAKCLAVIVDDPDAPIAPWIHWIIWNINITKHIKENEVHGCEGLNDFQQFHYSGPCPPPFGIHHYHFKVYALNSILELPDNTKKNELEKAMSEHIVAFGELVGLYKRNN